LLQTKHIILSY